MTILSDIFQNADGANLTSCDVIHRVTAISPPASVMLFLAALMGLGLVSRRRAAACNI